MADSKERPILFSGESVRAILDGRKTMTRRVIKPQCAASDCTVVRTASHYHFASDANHYYRAVSRQYEVGMKLWVRETFTGDWRGTGIPARGCINYRADGEIPAQYKGNAYWRPSIFMPRWASRITLEITGIKVERLKDISEIDCERELGVELFSLGNEAYPTLRQLWDSINAARGYSFESSPWVWAIEFKRA